MAARGSGTASSTEEDERTVALARRRFARRQWARRFLAWRGVAVLAALAVGVAVLVWLVFFSSVLAVSGVTVAGTDVLSHGAVRRAAEVPMGTPLATVDLHAISARVKKLPAVAGVDVSRAWPNAVRIDVHERAAVAVVDRGGHLRGVDDHGVLFRGYRTRPDLPLIRTRPGTHSDALAEAARVAASLPASLSSRVDFVQVHTVDTISLRLHDGRTVRWGSADDSAQKATVLAVLLRQKASTYDVSVPGQPIIRR